MVKVYKGYQINVADLLSMSCVECKISGMYNNHSKFEFYSRYNRKSLVQPVLSNSVYVAVSISLFLAMFVRTDELIINCESNDMIYVYLHFKIIIIARNVHTRDPTAKSACRCEPVCFLAR